MSHIFLEDELDAIRAARDAADLGTGNWADVYATILGIIGIGGERKPWIEESVWLWFEGAEDINRGQGDFSNFIRSYTEEQYRLRFGAAAAAPSVQAMSDEVARSVTSYILLNGRLPDLRALGLTDEAAVAEEFFAGDRGAWSGNPLFVPLGDSHFYGQNILSSSLGAYDFGAMMWSSREALGEIESLADLFLEVGRTIRDNNSGFFGTFWSSFVLSFDTSDMLSEQLGISLPEFFAHTLAVSTLNVGETVLDTSDDDLLFGGRLADVFRLTLGYDIVDGGEGEDTVDYAGALGPVEIEIGGHDKDREDVVRVKKDTNDAIDWLYAVETIRGTSGDDTAFLRELPVEGTVPKLDGAGGVDTFSAAGLAPAVALTLAVGQIWEPVSITTADGAALSVTAFERFELGEGADVVAVGGLPDPWDGVPDPAAPADAPDKLVFEGGLGDDTFSVDVAMGAPAVMLLGGGGDDVFEIGGGWDENGSEPWQDPYYRPLVVHGGAGVDTLKITGSTSLIFVQVSDPTLLHTLDLDALGASVATGRGHSGTVVLVNPEAQDVIEWNGRVLSGGAPLAVRDVQTQTDTYSHETYFGYYDATLQGNVVVGADLKQYDSDITSYYYNEGPVSYGGYVGRGIGEYGDEGAGTFFYAADGDTYDTLIFTNFVNGDAGITFGEDSGGAMNTRTVRSWTNDWNDPSDTLDYYSSIDGPYTSWFWTGDRYLAQNPIVSAWDYEGSTTTSEAAWDPFDAGFGDASLRPSIDHLLAPPAPLSGSQSLQSQFGAELVLAGFQTGSTTSADIHTGTTGDDLLIGTDRDDVFLGGAGRDGIYGHAGQDRIDGGADDDLFRAGTGEDTFVFREGDGADLIERFDVAMDRISLVGPLTPDDLSIADDGVDTVIATAAGTSFTLLGVTGRAKSDFVFIDDATDAVLAPGPISPIFGTPGDDAIRGGAARERLHGFDGDDRLDGGDGDDVLEGGAGADDHVLRPGGGVDAVVGFDVTLDRVALDGLAPTALSLVDDGADALLQTPDGAGLRFLGGAGLSLSAILFVDAASGLPFPPPGPNRALVEGTAGDDTLIGGVGDEELRGLAGDDFLWGVDGDNLYDGGAGADFLRSGAGADTFVFRAGDGADVVETFDVANDRIALDGVSVTDLAFLDHGDASELTAADGTSFWFIGLTGVTLRDLVLVSADTGAILVVPPAAPIEGTEGDDLLYGTFDGETLIGGGGSDLLEGYGGDDVLDGGAGDDTLAGGAGADTIVFGYASELDQVWGFDPTQDRIALVGLRPEDLTFSDFGSASRLRAENGSHLYFHGLTGLTKNDIVFVSHETGEVLPSTTPRVIGGTAGDDTLLGADENNVLLGLDGADHLDGVGGDDRLDGGAGDDTLVGGAGVDTIVFRSGDGQDQAWGFDTATDRIALDGPAPGDLVFTAFADAAQLTAPDGSHIFFHGLTGVAKSDFVFVSPVTGAVLDEAGRAITEGSAGADQLVGHAGADRLLGTGGDDVLDGAGGDDLLVGGLDADTFVFRLGDGADTIADFDPASDRIALDGMTEQDLTLTDDGVDTLLSAADGTSFLLSGVTGQPLAALDFVPY